MMETKEWKSPSGWIVEYKVDLTYGESLELQKFVAGAGTVSSSGVTNLDATKLQESLMMTYKFLVVKVVKPDKTEYKEEPGQVLQEMPAREAKDIQTIIMGIVKDATSSDSDAQKKTT